MALNRRNFWIRVGRNWIFFFLILLLLVFSFTGRNFFSPRTFNNILVLSAPALLLATGETFVIITGGIDLSIGFVRGLSSVSSAIVMRDLYNKLKYPQGVSIAIGIIVGLLVAVLPGIVNGILVARYRVPPFIATLGMYGIANGLALKLCGGFPITFLPPKAGEIGNSFIAYYLPGKYFGFFRKPPGIAQSEVRNLIGIIPFSFVVALVFAIIFAFILSKTRFGQHTYAIGGNIDAAIRAGINVKRHLIWIYTISSFFAGLAGVLSVLIFSVGNFTQFAASYELFAIAAVVIGGASLMGGKGNIWGTFVGVLILSVLEVGFLMSGVLPFYRYIAVGAILVFAVIIDQSFPELIYE